MAVAEAPNGAGMPRVMVAVGCRHVVRCKIGVGVVGVAGAAQGGMTVSSLLAAVPVDRDVTLRQ